MKTILALLMFVSIQAVARDPKADIVEKFKETYKNSVITNVVNKGWFIYVYAKEGEVKSVLKYNRKGSVVDCMRYFTSEHLTPMQAIKLKTDYPNMKIHCVTEWSANNITTYRIVLHDDKKWVHIDSDSNANFKVFQEFDKI